MVDSGTLSSKFALLRKDSRYWKFVLGGGLPAYLSLIVSALAVALVYYGWSAQERVKKRAELSIEAFRAAHELAQCFHQVAFVVIKDGRTQDDIKKLGLEQHEHAEKCDAITQKLSGISAVISVAVDAKAGEILEEQVEFHNNRTLNFLALAASVDDPQSFQKAGETKEELQLRLMEELRPYDTRLAYVILPPEKKAEEDKRKKSRSGSDAMWRIVDRAGKALEKYMVYAADVKNGKR